MYRKNILKVLGASTFVCALVFAFVVSADVSGSLLPQSDGSYLQWTPKSGTVHYTQVDETTCNGTTDYNFTTTVGNRDSYGVSIATIPIGAKITQIDITPCASRNGSGGTNPVMNVFYRYNGSNSSDSGSYSLTGTTPTTLAATSYSSLSLFKSPSSTLEVGAVLTSSTKGARLGRIQAFVTYTTLSAPSNLLDTSSTTTAGVINMAWTDNSTIEDNFAIERSTDNLNWTQIASTSANAVSYSDTGLSLGTLYYHRVRAYDAGGFSSYSNTSSTTTANVPSVPSSLTATSATTTASIKLDWTDNSSNENNFLVERSPNGSNSWTNIATTTANTITYNNTGLSQNTTYYYRVRAVNSIGYSGYTSTASATTTGTPLAPSGLSSNLSGADISLTWTDNSSNESSFNLERSLNGITFLHLATTSADAITYLDMGLSSSTTYYYRLNAYNAIGYSAYSNIASSTTP